MSVFVFRNPRCSEIANHPVGLRITDVLGTQIELRDGQEYGEARLGILGHRPLKSRFQIDLELFAVFQSDALLWEPRNGDIFPWRRKIKLEDSKMSVLIKLLFGKLSYITNTATWGIAFRGGYLKITDKDYDQIIEGLEHGAALGNVDDLAVDGDLGHYSSKLSGKGHCRWRICSSKSDRKWRIRP